MLSGLIGVAGSVWQVGMLWAGAWTARGLRVPARNGLLADVVPAEAYGRAYGFERAMDDLGAVIGPLLAIALVGTERLVVVLGDLNDEPQAATTQILLGPPGSEFQSAGFDRPDKGDDMRLWNLAPRLAALHPDRAFTRRFRDQGELIDHLLVSHVLAHALEDVNTADPTPASITENPAKRRDAPASDHAPLVARFALNWACLTGLG